VSIANAMLRIIRCLRHSCDYLLSAAGKLIEEDVLKQYAFQGAEACYL